MKMRTQRWIVLAVVAAVGAALAACGSTSSSSTQAGGVASSNAAQTSSAADSSGTVDVNVGTATPIHLKKGKIKVAIIMEGQSNAYLTNFAHGAQAVIQNHGDTAKIFDSGGDLSTELNIIQTVAQQKYDAAVVLPINGQTDCSAVTHTLPAANVLVSVGIGTICHPPTVSGNALWAPGILTFVGSNNTVPFVSAWLDAAAKANPGKQNVAVVIGPPDVNQTILVQAAIKKWLPSHPDFHIANYVYTDFTTPDALAKTQAYLGAHPDISLILAVYSPDLARGTIQALSADGKLGKIKVDDIGGDRYTYPLIKNGDVQLTIPYFPQRSGGLTAQAILDAQAGKKVPRYIDDTAMGGTYSNPPIITKDNLNYTPGY
jgi:ribose transport system substrate-binding protein